MTKLNRVNFSFSICNKRSRIAGYPLGTVELVPRKICLIPNPHSESEVYSFTIGGERRLHDRFRQGWMRVNASPEFGSCGFECFAQHYL
jgi:hypothetical protein